MCYVDSFLPNGTAVANNNANPYVNGAGAALVNWFPAPNADPFTNPFGYNYIKQLEQDQDGGVFRATLQYNINSTNNLFFVYGLQREIDQEPVDVNNQFPTGSVPYPGAITEGDISNVLSARYSHFFGASVTNQFIAAMSFVSWPGKMGDPTAVDRFDIAGNGGNGFNYLGMYKNNDDYSVPALSGGGSNGYPNLSMPGGFYQNQVHTKQVDPILQDNVSWQLKNHFLEFGIYGETGTFNGTAFVSYPQGEYTFNPANAYFEYSSTNQAPYNGCENPNPAGNLRNSGAAYLGSCYNPTAMMYEGYADSFTQTNFTPLVDMRYTTLAGFANDTFKMHNLTLILACGSSISALGRTGITTALATFSDSLYNSQCGGYTRNCASSGFPGITWYSQKTGVSNSVNSTATINLTPRLGASWDISGKGRTILRGGWGIYRNQEQFDPYAFAAATAQGYKTSYLAGSVDLQPDRQPIAHPASRFQRLHNLAKQDTARPIYYEFNGGIDEAIPGVGFLHMGPSHLSVAYVGNESVNLSSYNGGATIRQQLQQCLGYQHHLRNRDWLPDE